jgi:WD40 repeat protein
MPWPLSQDYNEAVQNPHVCFADADLRAGEVATNALGLPMPRSGNFADVYEVRNPATGGRWAVKCFTRQVPGLRERYAAVSAHLRQARLRYAVDVQYLEQGVLVRGCWYPVLKMEWVEGLLLNDFVRQQVDRPAMLGSLAAIWERLGRRLREAGLAHGDLQHGNVLLVPGRDEKHLALRVIDYDGMWVPALAGQRSGEVGHPNYQHPQRLREGTYGPEVDRFPLLVVYVALRGLMVGGRVLWERYDNGDNLLFREQDLRSPRESPLVWELARLPDPELRRLVDCLSRAAYKPLDQVQLLDDLVGGGTTTAATSTTGHGTAAPVEGQVLAAPPRRSYPVARPAVPGPVPALVPDGKDTGQLPQKRRGLKLLVASLAGLAGGVCVLVCGLAFWAASLPGEAGRKPAALAQRAETVRWAREGLKAKQSTDNDPSSPGAAVADGQPRAKDKTPAAAPRASEPARSEPPSVPVKDEPPPPGSGQPNKEEPKKGPDPVARKEEPTKPPDQPKKEEKLPAGVASWPEAVGEVRRFDHGGEVRRVAVSPDGRAAVSACWDKLMRLWGLYDGRELRQYPRHPARVQGVAFLPDGVRALSAGDDRTVRLWDLGTGRLLLALTSHQQEIYYVAASPHGRLAASCGPESTVFLWDLESGKALRRLEGHAGGASSLAFAPDSKSLLVGTNQGPIRLWDVATGKEVRRLEGHASGVYALAFSPDGRYVLSGGEDGTVRVWFVSYARQVRRLEGHAGQVWGVAFSPDGRRAVSCGQDKTVRLWDVLTGQEVRTFAGHTAHVWDVAFCPDGGHVLSGGADHTLRLWRLPPAPPASGGLLDIDLRPSPAPSRPDPPNAAVAAEAEAQIEQLYKRELANRAPDNLRALGTRFLQLGLETKGKPVERFVLLREAYRQAAPVGDLKTAFQAAEALDKDFSVDVLDLKADALEKATHGVLDPAARQTVLDTAMGLVNAARDVDNYSAAEHLLAAARAAAPATRSAALQARVQRRASEIETLHKEYNTIRSLAARLVTNPRDPDACLAVGKFGCLHKGDWDTGLLLLAAGGDGSLAAQARQDLHKAAEPGAQVAVGDGWWALAENETGLAQAQLQGRARFWYRRALPQLTGLDKGKIEDKLKLIIGPWEGKPGLVAEFFADGNLVPEKKVTARIDYQTNFDWKTGSPEAGVPANNFSIRWHGYLYAPRPGRYTLVVAADDGARLYLDDRLVLDSWSKIERRTAAVWLDDKPHLLRLEYHQVSGPDNIYFGWIQEDGFAEQGVPAEALYHDQKQERRLTK